MEVLVFFDKLESKIKPEYPKKLIKAGKQLQALLLKAHRQSIENELDVKYLVIVEGMAARDSKNRQETKTVLFSRIFICSAIAGHLHW